MLAAAFAAEADACIADSWARHVVDDDHARAHTAVFQPIPSNHPRPEDSSPFLDHTPDLRQDVAGTDLQSVRYRR
jgi:hypothetical protein